MDRDRLRTIAAVKTQKYLKIKLLSNFIQSKFFRPSKTKTSTHYNWKNWSKMVWSPFVIRGKFLCTTKVNY
jgi:hypothetical protein